MKILKRIFLFLVSLVLLMGLGVLVCAFSPKATELAAEWTQNLLHREDIVTAPSTEETTDGGYRVPEDIQLAVPEILQEKSGYQPVSEEQQKIGKSEADRLAETLSRGRTGEEYSFDPLYYPYYAMLDDTCQSLYRQVYANAMERVDAFSPVVPVSTGQVKSVFEAVYNDHPEIFWIETGYLCKYLETGICVEIALKYNETAQRYEEASEAFQAAAGRILEGCREMEPADQEKYLHDALVEGTEYETNAPMNQSAYSCLVNGQSVCAGYARAFQYLMMQLAIPCYYCTGTAVQEHAWNIVQTQDGYANVDVTWDDTEPSTYDYYNKSDSDYASTHIRTGMSVRLPLCGDRAAVEETEEPVSDMDQLINPSPMPPLEWEGDDSETEDEAEQDRLEEEAKKEQENLDKAGITKEEVLPDLDAYFADCLEHLSVAGLGNIQFDNVIPESLWPVIENVYRSGAYWSGYATKTLELLGGTNFSVQLQVQSLGGGYNRVYHNMVID